MIHVSVFSTTPFASTDRLLWNPLAIWPHGCSDHGGNSPGRHPCPRKRGDEAGYGLYNVLGLALVHVCSLPTQAFKLDCLEGPDIYDASETGPHTLLGAWTGRALPMGTDPYTGIVG